jgi:hypothetical protein
MSLATDTERSLSAIVAKALRNHLAHARGRRVVHAKEAE